MKEKRKHVFLRERTLENDIAFRGPLSYRHLRIIGWLLMICAQVGILFGIAASIVANKDTSAMQTYNNWSTVFSMFGSGAISLFLVANFAIILQSREGITRVLLTHLFCVVGFYLGFFVLYRHYICGYFSALAPSVSISDLDSVVSKLLSSHLSFNIFIDLLMYSSTYFFLIYKPKKLFQDKKIIIFRLLVILPIAYEIACFLLKGFANGMGYFDLPVLVAPLMCTKPLLTYLAFVIVIMYIRIRKRLYLRKKKGKTEEDYQNFLQTNANSLSLSLFISITFLIVSILDFIIAIVVGVIYTKANLPQDSNELITALVMDYTVALIKNWGIGQSVDLIIGVPFIMLFSYTKKYKDPKARLVDLIVPIAGVILIVITYAEGGMMLLRLVTKS